MARPIVREPIERLIHTIRGERVMLDANLARISVDEARDLRSQIVISSLRHGGRRYHPYAFTEQGVAMLSGVLRSPRAIAANVAIMRVFVRFRRLLTENAELIHRLNELEQKYDAQFKIVFDAIRTLMTEPVRPRRRIGFDADRHESGPMTTQRRRLT